MGTSTAEHEVDTGTNHLIVQMKIQVTITNAKEDGDAQDGEATTSPSPAVPVVLPPPPPAPKDITEQSFRVEKTYNLLSVDGQRVLSASNRKSDRQNKHGGYRMDFLEDRTFKSRGASAEFTFSGHPEEYRMHSGVHHNNMLYFLGPSHQLDWVVWDWAVPTDGDWERLKMCWLGDDDVKGGRTRFKMKFKGYFVKWAVSGFTGVKEWDAATEFILREI